MEVKFTETGTPREITISWLQLLRFKTQVKGSKMVDGTEQEATINQYGFERRQKPK